MKIALSRLFTKLAYVYQYKQKKDSEEAKRLAYVGLRNFLGAILFFILFLIHSIIDLFIVSFSPYIRSLPRLYLYFIFAVFISTYLLFARKHLKPKLIFQESIEVNKEKLKSYNRMYIGLVIFMGVLGGLIYGVNRLLYIYFS